MKNLIAFFLLITSLTSYAESQEKIEIPMKVERDVSLISVNIGNIEIPNILLDTGFDYDGIIIYNPDYRDSLDLTGAIDVQIGGAGGGDDSNALLIDSASFSIGDVKMIDQRIIILQSNRFKGFPSNGVIGYSVFGYYITECDYDRNIMSLYTTDNVDLDSTWTAIPLYFKGNNVPWLDASIVIEKEYPIPLSVYIDFAARDVIMLLEKPDMKFSLPKDTVDVHIGTGLSGDIYGKRGSISKLIIGKHEFYNVIASLATSKVRSKQDNADAILGSGALRRFNIIFDYSHQILYLKPNSHFNDSFK